MIVRFICAVICLNDAGEIENFDLPGTSEVPGKCSPSKTPVLDGTDRINSVYPTTETGKCISADKYTHKQSL